jgi:2,5-furandicarboxylate decarboxylase 1
MPYTDLRDFLNTLQKEKELIVVSESLDPCYEVASLLQALSEHDSYPAALIENVKGYAVPIAGNLFGSRKRAALALETKEGKVAEKYLRRKKNPIQPQIVSNGPIKEVILQKDLDLATVLPVLTYHEKDAGQYMTQGVVFLKDPKSEHQSMGIHRIHIKGERLINIAFESKTSNEYLHRAEQENAPLEVAIALGLDPALIMAAVAWFPFGDKLELAGGLRREPVELIPAETVDIKVPAHAMFVLEGLIQPNSREPEGPFGESSGYYITLNSPVAEIHSISHQTNPIYPVFIPCSLDDGIPLSICWSSEVLASLQKDFPSVIGVNFNVLNTSIIVSIKKREPTEARRILHTLLVSHPFMKNAVIVDEDIDIFNPRDVDWALGSRFQPDRDLIKIDHVAGSPLDPSCEEEGVTAKMGLDATKPFKQKERFERARSSPDNRKKVEQLLTKYLS